ncbi:hypothetical protein CLIB1423_03S00210 [[Candida] railenensis]|uniref:Uncharacterized protein n=1 Tax=[Candida] railenensis TaxID=45579 RepID=A0A9P0VX48_9ASCO|nr:hypothetical protein CLIB1423_03S00210 [[Candida] railenensis]
MSRNVTGGPPFLHKLIVGTVAVAVGVYAAWDASKDFELVKYTPFSEEEVLKRQQEKKGLKITHLDTRTLDYTPEAKERLRKVAEEEKLKAQADK